MKLGENLFDFGTRSSVSLRIAGNVLLWGTLSQYVFYYIGLGPLIPILIVWPAIFFGLYLVFEETLKKFHWLPFIWFISMMGLLIQGLIQFYLNGIGGTYIIRWFFGFGIAAFLPFIGMLTGPRIIYKAASYLGMLTIVYCFVVLCAMATDWNISRVSFLPDTNVIPASFLHIAIIAQETSTTGEKRALAFAPYATYAGAIGCFYLLLCLADETSLRRRFGIGGWVFLILLTRSRTALICMILGVCCYYVLSFRRRYLMLCAGVGLFVVALGFQQFIDWGERASTYIQAQRGSSSEVRNNLRTIAFDEWRFGENPVLGTGRSIPGGEIVANMPIGTHDSYHANLLMRGGLGTSLIFFPIFVTLMYGIISGRSPEQRSVATGMVLLLAYAYAESLESLYMYIWPSLLIIGSMSFMKNVETS